MVALIYKGNPPKNGLQFAQLMFGIAEYQVRSGRFDVECLAALSKAEPLRQTASLGWRQVWRALLHFGDRTEQLTELVAQRARSAINRAGSVR